MNHGKKKKIVKLDVGPVMTHVTTVLTYDRNGQAPLWPVS